jgi:DNA-binding transcriptional LysR family regulator
MVIELQRFLLVANKGNITKSAEQLFITQSALTQSIQRLEKTLGTKLFIQKGKYLQLTEDGRAVATIAEKIILLWENAKDPQQREKQQQTFSIGLYDNAALRLGPFIQKNLSEKSLQLELTIEGSTALFTKLTVGILDAAVCVTSPKIIPPRNISLVQTFSERLIPVSSKKFTGKLETIPFIFYNKHSHSRQQTDLVFEKHKTNPRIFAESTSTTFMKELALLGSGVSLLPENFVRSEIAQGTLIKQKLPFKWYREYGLFSSNDSPLIKNHPLVMALVKELKRSK